MRSGVVLRERLVIVVSGVAAVVALVAAASYTLIARAEARALAVYETHVLPTSALRTVSDSYAIDVVDTIHKVCARRLDISEGAKLVTRALAVSDASWRVYADHTTSPDAVRGTQPLLAAARAAATKAQALMLAADLNALEEFRTRRMYAVIEPLTQQLAGRVAYEITRTDALVKQTRLELRELRVGTSIVLIAVALAGWAYVVRFSRRLARSITGMEFVVRRVAEGDVTQRALHHVDDAFADMAADIDFMIDALARSHADLETHAAELERAAERAQSANTAKTLFLGSMSHELRTPLNVILGYAQILARQPQRSERDRRALQRVMQAGTHLLGLIDDVLSIAKIEAGTLGLRPAAFDSQSVTDTIRGMFTERAEQKGIALHIAVDADVPRWLHADAGRLRQVLVNLVSNAMKFTEHGEVRVRLWYSPGQLRASVADTGRGIPADELARLFERFYQGTAGRNTAEGAGLGLYISRSLVRLMGGELTATSTPGAGSTFTFDIAASPSAPEMNAPIAVAKPRLPPGTVCDPMLVVDDRLDNREVLGRLLRQLGFAVREVGGGAEAVEACARDPYAMVWMDLHMPGMSGVEATRLIRERDAAAGRARRKIVAVTASVIELDREAARDQGFDELLGKPFQDTAVTTLISGTLGLQFVEEAGEPPEPTAQERAAVAAEQRRARAGLAELPNNLRSELLSALIAGDAALAHVTLDRVEPRALSDALRAIVDSYAYDALIAELRSVNSRAPNTTERKDA